MLAAQVLKLCNSAAMATREPCKTISQAVSRLGSKNLRNTLMEISARRLFESHDPKMAATVKALWEHSRAVAQLAQRVAVVSGAADPDTAYLAGLLHDVGKPVVATMLLEAESQITQRNPKLWIDFPPGWTWCSAATGPSASTWPRSGSCPMKSRRPSRNAPTMTRPTSCPREMPCVSPMPWSSNRASTPDQSMPTTTTPW